jgi:hypothetical protein
MQTIVIKHLSGARANQVDQFSTGSLKELTVGRDVSSQVRFDPDQDDLVSRQHVKIVRDPVDAAGFQLVDLQSRNGTFVNRQRIYGTVKLNHFDVIQLGAGGPEFRFEVDPPPASGARPTREASFDNYSDPASRPTRTWIGASSATTAPSMAAPGLSTAPRPVGRATVERMLGDVFSRAKHDSNRSAWWLGSTVVAAILLVGGGIWYYLQKSDAAVKEAQEQIMASNRRINEELKKNPRAINSVKKELDGLVAKVNKLDPAQQAVVKGQISETQHRLDEVSTTPGTGAAGSAAAKVPVAGSKTVAVADTAPPPVDPGLANASYDSLMEQATERFQHGKKVGALDLVKIAIAKEPGKWEGYEFAGQLEEQVGNYGDAVTFLEQALQKAPSDAKQDIQYKLDALKQKEAKR